MAGKEKKIPEHLFPSETELSEIVRRKTDCAFEKIRQEESGMRKMTEKNTNQAEHKKEKARGGRFRVPAAAIAGVCLLAACSISAAAALRYYWGRGMNGILQATDGQQRELVEQGIAKVYEMPSKQEKQSGEGGNAEGAAAASAAVTCDGVTIAPETVIADEKVAYLSFRISGFHAEAWEEVSANLTDIYLADDPDGEESWVNMSSHIYTGITADEEGNLVYDDGTPVAYDEEGRTLNHYTDENGDIDAVEYVKDAAGNRKPVIQSWARGRWAFDIQLPDVSAAEHIAVGQPVADTAFTVESIELSPISVHVHYEVNGVPETKQDENGIPTVIGLILQDGTRLPETAGTGGSGYLDSEKNRAQEIAGFDRAVEVDEVAGLILSVWNGGSEYRTVDVMLRK